uniref:Uncharacterized protein n=1 Tax=Arundo donax TaxID=35708 RepID=A0A0A8YQD8_ARUDO
MFIASYLFSSNIAKLQLLPHYNQPTPVMEHDHA